MANIKFNGVIATLIVKKLEILSPIPTATSIIFVNRYILLILFTVTGFKIFLLNDR